jgi:hypothetical protein
MQSRPVSQEYLSTEQFNEYCDLIADGSTTRKAAAEIGKARNHIHVWLQLYGNDSLRNQYARAQRDSATIYAEKAIETAEDVQEDVQRSRLKVDVYKWSAEKKDPSHYGNRSTQVLEGGDKPVETKLSGQLDIGGPIADHITRILNK